MIESLYQRRSAVATSLLLAFIALAPVHAQQPEGARLAESARCYMCHQMSESLLAPPYLAIAARHTQRADVMVNVLARKIVDGGGGNWGVVPMAPNQGVSLEDARIMAEWILSLAPQTP